MTVINFYEAGAKIKKKELGLAKAILWLVDIIVRMMKILANTGARVLDRARASHTVGTIQTVARKLEREGK
jgi:hypothetical protein